MWQNSILVFILPVIIVANCCSLSGNTQWNGVRQFPCALLHTGNSMYFISNTNFYYWLSIFAVWLRLLPDLTWDITKLSVKLLAVGRCLENITIEVCKLGFPPTSVALGFLSTASQQPKPFDHQGLFTEEK